MIESICTRTSDKTEGILSYYGDSAKITQLVFKKVIVIMHRL